MRLGPQVPPVVAREREVRRLLGSRERDRALGRERPAELERPLAQLARLVDGVDEAVRERLLGADLPAREDELLGAWATLKS